MATCRVKIKSGGTIDELTLAVKNRLCGSGCKRSTMLKSKTPHAHFIKSSFSSYVTVKFILKQYVKYMHSEIILDHVQQSALPSELTAGKTTGCYIILTQP